MRKIILSVMVSLDGFFEGSGEGWQKIDWHRADEEKGCDHDNAQRAEAG